MASQIPRIPLAGGSRIPQVGLGVLRIPPDQTQQVVEQALGVGYRHVDTAAGYDNEAGVGAALAASGLPRQDVWITTKVRDSDQGYEQTLQAFERQRRALGVDYVDLYLIHWPVPQKDLYVPTWRAFIKLRDEGLVREIGVCNFLPEHLDRLVAETGVAPAVNQIELHPTFQQRAVQAAARAHGAVVEAYSPLARGADLGSGVLEGIAAAHGVSPAQVALRWHVDHGVVVIPKTVHVERMRENLDLFGFDLTAEESARIDALDSDERRGHDPRTYSYS